MSAAAIGTWVRLAALAVSVAFAAPAQAQQAAAKSGPIVVELFTSQGCSSCPPADAFMATLAPRDDVIALALHVDYWDYIGWKDIFADPRNTRRQKTYAHFAGRRSVYTPQMVIHGKEDVVGTHPMDVADLIRKHRAQAVGVMLEVSRTEHDQVVIRARALRDFAAPLVVHLVRYRPRATVKIERGENAGRKLIYSNIVTDFRSVGEWNPTQPLDMRADAAGDQPVVVMIQEPGPGAILAAARLR